MSPRRLDDLAPVVRPLLVLRADYHCDAGKLKASRCRRPPDGAGRAGGDAGEIQTLRERMSALCAASVRISGSLDLPTLFGEIVDSGRALTGARYGAVTTVNADGRLQDFVNRGTTEAQYRRLLE